VFRARIRGGGDCGHDWFINGRAQHKMNSVHDLIACVETLHRTGLSSPRLTCATGHSAGALTVGEFDILIQMKLHSHTS
jgi:protease II